MKYFENESSIFSIVCFYHVTYEFESESTLYSCLNVKELLARNRRHIWRLNDCNGTRTHNHLVRKRTLNHLAKLAIWLNGWMFVYELSGCGFESRCSHSYLPCLFYRQDINSFWVLLICSEKKMMMLLHFKILFYWDYEMLHIGEHLPNCYILEL